MHTVAEMMARVHLGKAEEYWLADRLGEAHAAMAMALNAGVPPSDVFDRQRTIDAELAARRAAERVRVGENVIVECPDALDGVGAPPPDLRRSIAGTVACVADLWSVRWGKPVLVTIFTGPGASLFMHSRYGYYAERSEVHKVCLPVGVARSPELLEMALLHEVAHAALHNVIGEGVPRWFDEGIAVWTEGGCSPIEQRRLRLAAARKRIPRMQQVEAALGSYAVDLDSGEAAVAYASAGAFMGYLVERFGVRKVRMLWDRMRRGSDVARAMRADLGRDLRTLESDWRAVSAPT